MDLKNLGSEREMCFIVLMYVSTDLPLCFHLYKRRTFFWCDSNGPTYIIQNVLEVNSVREVTNDVHAIQCLNDEIIIIESNEKAMNRNWDNQKAHPALKTKMENNQNHKQTKYNENKWLTDG